MAGMTSSRPTSSALPTCSPAASPAPSTPGSAHVPKVPGQG